MGQIKRIKTSESNWPKVGYIIKGCKNKSGYSCVMFSKDGKIYNKQVHRLVLETFDGPYSEGMECNHKNGVKTDNRLENLEWLTHSDNAKHRDNVLHPYLNKGHNNKNAKLTENQILAIRELCQRGHSQARIAEWFNVTRGAINKIYRRKLWKHIH